MLTLRRFGLASSAMILLLAAQACLAETIHVLIVADTNVYGNNRYGLAAQQDMANLSMLFRGLVPAGQLDLQTLSGDQVTRSNILRHLQRIRATRRDGVVFIWSGHGAYDSRGHHFQMPNGSRLYRAEVVDAVRDCGAGSDVVLSSSCNVYSGLPGEPAAGEPAAGAATQIPPLMRSLFLDAGGLVDINGASRDEYTVGFPGRGTTFFLPLLETLALNMDRPMSWSRFEPLLRNAVDRFFRQELPDGLADGNGRRGGRTQYGQHIQTWHLPDMSPGGWPPRDADYNPPTSRYVAMGRWHPEVGDVIISVNGHRIASRQGCITAVNHSPAIMEFEAWDSETGTVYRYRTRLLTGDQGSRFGVNLKDTGGNGAQITGLHSDMPVMKCQVDRGNGWE